MADPISALLAGLTPRRQAVFACLRNCLSDSVHVGVMRRVKPRLDAQTEILGVALVANYSDDGLFDLRGSTAAGVCELRDVNSFPNWVAAVAESLEGAGR